MLPTTRFDHFNRRTGNDLLAANASKIATFGSKNLMIYLPVRNCSWTFVVAGVARPLLGADFLRANLLLVVVLHNRLVDTRLLCLKNSP